MCPVHRQYLANISHPENRGLVHDEKEGRKYYEINGYRSFDIYYKSEGTTDYCSCEPGSANGNLTF
jgi:hypothetical protein